METVKKKKGMIFALILAETVCLTGCTGKELEQRRFPLALAVDSVQDQVVLSCAWPGEEGGETGESGGGKTENREDGKGEAEKGETEKSQGEKYEEVKEEAEEDETEKGQGEKEDETKEEAVKGETVESSGNDSFVVDTETITQAAGATIQEAAEAVQAFQDKYVDYSQVKAILWGPGLEEDPKLADQVKDWLEKTPAFARNLLVFDQERSGLDLETIQEKSRGQAGAYLENLYENQTLYRNSARMLQDLLYGDG